MFSLKKVIFLSFILVFFVCLFSSAVFAAPVPDPTPCIAPDAGTGQPSPCVIVDKNTLGFTIPSFSDILSFAIRLVFIGGGLVALAMLLLGAVAWIMSGGDKEKIQAAQQKIQAAIVGVIMIVIVLAIVVTLEQVVFARKICLGLSCPITIPSLLKPNGPTSNQNNSVIEQIVATPTPTIKRTVIITPTVIPKVIIVTPTSSVQGDPTNHPYNIK